MFPIYRNDDKPICPLSNDQKEAINRFKQKIDTGKYTLIDNKCLCGNHDNNLDVIISEKDRYGIPVQSILCSKCGIIRSSKVLEERSNVHFYKDEYRAIYVGDRSVPQSFFEDQKRRGTILLNLFSKHAGEAKGMSVFEIGCGAGGVVYPFAEAGNRCSGNDYDETYLAYGKQKKMDLRYGDYHHILENNSVDILILCHVLEHFIYPLSELKEIIKKIKPMGWLIIEVPGIFYINKVYYNPLLYLQNAHVYNFYGYYLNVLFRTFGLDVLYWDERCTFIVRKPLHWIERDVSFIHTSSLDGYFKKIKNYLIRSHYLYELRLNPYQIRNNLQVYLDSLKK